MCQHSTASATSILYCALQEQTNGSSASSAQCNTHTPSADTQNKNLFWQLSVLCKSTLSHWTTLNTLFKTVIEQHIKRDWHQTNEICTYTWLAFGVGGGGGGWGPKLMTDSILPIWDMLKIKLNFLKFSSWYYERRSCDDTFRFDDIVVIFLHETKRNSGLEGWILGRWWG
jgi:hypothetical protein